MNTSSHPFAAITSAYYTALHTNDNQSALAIIHEALEQGASLATLYHTVIQPAMYQIGQQWERGELSVGAEHQATAITRMVLDICAFPYRPGLYGAPDVLAACVSPEQHDIGLRMVADCLEFNGWRTLYLGGNVPLDDIVMLTLHHQVAIVALSVTMGSHALHVRHLITALRQTALGPHLKILVGGQPFNRIPNLWQRVGADGAANDALAAVEWVNQVLLAPTLPAQGDLR
jgi:methanogenic corrinoid protein MtbC1